MENEYTVIFTIYRRGQSIIPTTKENVRTLCERYKAMSKLDDKFNNKNNETSIKTIEVLNNKTGEIREYWNNIKK